MTIRTRYPQAVELRLLAKLCETVNSPYSLRVFLLLKNQQFEDILDCDFDVTRYINVDEFRSDYMIYSFLRKWKGWRSPKPTQQVALDAWKDAEDMCRQTNSLLRSVREGSSCFINRKTDAAIHAARRKIASVLGPFDLRACLSECRWGPGATADFRRGTTPDQKHSGVFSVTRQALELFKLEVEHDPHWLALLLGSEPQGPCSLLPINFNIIDYNRLVTVAKNYKTDRPISAEPTANSFLQQGFGRYIRSRLKRWGIDLNDQSINQRRARDAFQHRYATIDLSSASDTLSRELVFELLPIDWALWLDRLRVPYTKLPDGSKVRLEKFSGMGNAFTFELESLIFWAICHVFDNEVTVYGDDIVCHTESYADITSCLSDLGFKVNHSKSFSQGPFYESCGGQYFMGHDVTPIFQKEVISSAPHHVISAFNRVYRWSSGAFKAALRLIRNEWNLDAKPEIPDFCTDDRGFLTPARFLDDPDIHGTYRCRVYLFHPRAKQAVVGFNLAYKLRCPGHSTPKPQGNGDDVTTLQGRWMLGRASITRFA